MMYMTDCSISVNFGDENILCLNCAKFHSVICRADFFSRLTTNTNFLCADTTSVSSARKAQLSCHSTLRNLSDSAAMLMTYNIARFANGTNPVFIVPGAKAKNLKYIRAWFPHAPIYVFNPVVCATDKGGLFWP